MRDRERERVSLYSHPQTGHEWAHWSNILRVCSAPWARVERCVPFSPSLCPCLQQLHSIYPEHAEADTFFCFAILMAEVGHHFTKKLDHSRAGIGKIRRVRRQASVAWFPLLFVVTIGGSMFRLMDLLKRKDPCLHKSLVSLWEGSWTVAWMRSLSLYLCVCVCLSLYLSQEEKRIDPTFYGFRWITLLLSQEFLLPGDRRDWKRVCAQWFLFVLDPFLSEVLRIWDSLFADSCRFDFLIYLCCSMLLWVIYFLSCDNHMLNLFLPCIFPTRCVRTELIEGDFAICVKLLQVNKY